MQGPHHVAKKFVTYNVSLFLARNLPTSSGDCSTGVTFCTVEGVSFYNCKVPLEVTWIKLSFS
jgi:hypothetical protein